MSYALYNSIRYFIPEARVCLAKKWAVQGVNSTWEQRCKIPFFLYEPDEDPLKIVVKKNIFGKDFKIVPLKAHVLAVREVGNLGPSDVHKDEETTFVDYDSGCGTFDYRKWIDRSDAPLRQAVKRFGDTNLSVNEMRVLKEWERSSRSYTLVS